MCYNFMCCKWENFITDYRNFTAYLRDKCHQQLFLLKLSFNRYGKFLQGKMGSILSDVHWIMGFNFKEGVSKQISILNGCLDLFEYGYTPVQADQTPQLLLNISGYFPNSVKSYTSLIHDPKLNSRFLLYKRVQRNFFQINQVPLTFFFCYLPSFINSQRILHQNNNRFMIKINIKDICTQKRNKINSKEVWWNRNFLYLFLIE